MPLPAPKSAAVPEPAPVILQPVELSPPTPSIVSPTPRRANPSPGPPSATSDGVDTTFQGVNKLVAQWQKRAEEGTQPAKNNVNVDKKVPAWQKLR
ncbi:hypothetical protein DACRYDRAFT_21665 [Dacryopinax primogenitus]|uniref:Uncharacterized protein n=1 Tax=Dacryopinax primogenitus (strain DJM 731) TaxID=1858805 RepID=M5G1N1_DACPD|nr:uncharacterized protein DACRYDRAFT_21665 [Dacryopinax primogenitus]EJU02624.1 hypothetical protein DACRYDRAFT_21665 [Dacryopinax primogenitus]